MSASHESLTPVVPVFLVNRFPPLHEQLLILLQGLGGADWGRPTACALWSVKDLAAHLLDTSLRRLSLGRDGTRPTSVPASSGYSDLVAYLNRLNAEWTAAARRLSPRVLIELLEWSEPQVWGYFQSLDPYATAPFPVNWSGQDSSANWFDIGREYTERWLHQQQIREAVGAPLLSGREWLHPTLDIFVRALPFTYKEVAAPAGRSIRFEITGPAGGVWTLARSPQGWDLLAGAGPGPAARVSLDQEIAWKLFSKGLTEEAARRGIRIEGDRGLGEPVFRSLAVMA